MVKIKDKEYHLANALRENYSAGMKPNDIAALFHLSKQRVNYWIHREIKKRKRRTKLKKREINMFFRWERDKPIMEKQVYAKNIQIRFNKLPRKFNENRINQKISLI